MNDVQAVTFDLDGTLYDARSLRWRFALANLGQLRAVRVALKVREELRDAEFEDGEAYRLEEARRVAERLEVSVDEARARVDRLLGERLTLALAAAGPRPDARAALQRMIDLGIRVGVVSDYAVDDKLQVLGLAELPWQARIAADALGALKPNKRCYLASAAALGLPPERILHIGDRVDTDVEGARAAGLKALLLGPPVDGIPSALTLTQAVEQIFTPPA